MAEPTASREFGPEEVGLALRNHGMLLEGLRYDVTPVGMHYLLIHFDVPLVDPDTYALAVGGRVRNLLRLTLEDVRRRPALTIPVTMECSGNGRAHLSPRPISAPWREEAVGCAEWTGTPLGPILEEAGVLDDAVEVVFAGHDRGIDDGVEHDYERSMPVEDAMREEVLTRRTTPCSTRWSSSGSRRNPRRPTIGQEIRTLRVHRIANRAHPRGSGTVQDRAIRPARRQGVAVLRIPRRRRWGENGRDRLRAGAKRRVR